MDLTVIIITVLAMIGGGLVKGATGAGAPTVAVPVLAALVDVRFAVIIFAYPNFLANIYQVVRYRASFGTPRLWLVFSIGGFAGTLVGSMLLALVDPVILITMLAAVVTIYIVARLSRPDWVLSRQAGQRLAGPIGALGGVFYGAVALSGPISITFIAAMRPSRGEFIATMSAFFLAMGLSQMPALYALGLLTPSTTALGLTATAAMFVGMRLGEWLSQFMSAKHFDHAILVILIVVAIRLYWTLLT